MRRLDQFVFFLVFVILFAFAISFGPGLIEKTTPINAAPSVVPIVIVDSNGSDIGSANAIIVDENFGLLATNAHVVYDPNREALSDLKVWLSQTWQKVEAREEWTNYYADVAIVCIVDPSARLDIKKVARLSSSSVSPSLGDTVRIKGIVRNRGLFLPSWSDSGIPATAQVVTTHRYWGDDYRHSSDEERQRLLFLLPKNYLYRLYNDCFYIMDPNIDSLIGPWRTFRRGASGSAIEDINGTLVGILSGAGRRRGLGIVIPAYEIQNLLDKVRKDLTRR